MSLLNRRRRSATVANSVIADPEQHTTMDTSGAVRSIQAADVTMPEGELVEIWTPTNLERLARTYWKYLSRVTLGLIRVEYTDTERAVVLPHAPVRAAALPRAGLRDERRTAGSCAGRSATAILVARPRLRPPRDRRQARARAEPPATSESHVEVEVANFYPSIASWVGRWVYTITQSRIHVLVTHGFLRSLARLELEESAVGRFADRSADGSPAPRAGEPPVNVGDTPWLAWAGIAAGVAAVSLVPVPALRPTPLAVAVPVSARSLSRSWREAMRRTVPDRLRMTSDSVLAPRGPRSGRPRGRRRR